ncbi:MAG TPA: transcriptional repressor [Chloroflexota bacterium]|nr:transcriptional repressor [Chloroflexota bacterium]
MLNAAELRGVLKQRGLRMTPQRQLILEAIAASEGHMSAEGLYQQVAPRFARDL